MDTCVIRDYPIQTKFLRLLFILTFFLSGRVRLGRFHFTICLVYITLLTENCLFVRFC